MEELLVSSLAQTDALAKLLIEKGLITRREFMQKIFRGTGDVSEVAESDAAMKGLMAWIVHLIGKTTRCLQLKRCSSFFDLDTCPDNVIIAVPSAL